MIPFRPLSWNIFICIGVEKLCAYGVIKPDETPLGTPSDENYRSLLPSKFKS
jgi:hypothetical protein